jgi:hypothetical protein
LPLGFGQGLKVLVAPDKRSSFWIGKSGKASRTIQEIGNAVVGRSDCILPWIEYFSFYANKLLSTETWVAADHHMVKRL